jgi:hypothetical protein
MVLSLLVVATYLELFGFDKHGKLLNVKALVNLDLVC